MQRGIARREESLEKGRGRFGVGLGWCRGENKYQHISIAGTEG